MQNGQGNIFCHSISWHYCHSSVLCSQVGTVKLFWRTQCTEVLYHWVYHPVVLFRVRRIKRSFAMFKQPEVDGILQKQTFSLERKNRVNCKNFFFEEHYICFDFWLHLKNQLICTSKWLLRFTFLALKWGVCEYLFTCISCSFPIFSSTALILISKSNNWDAFSSP